MPVPQKKFRFGCKLEIKIRLTTYAEGMSMFEPIVPILLRQSLRYAMGS